jgi:hypothetical protein
MYSVNGERCPLTCHYPDSLSVYLVLAPLNASIIGLYSSSGPRYVPVKRDSSRIGSSTKLFSQFRKTIKPSGVFCHVFLKSFLLHMPSFCVRYISVTSCVPTPKSACLRQTTTRSGKRRRTTPGRGGRRVPCLQVPQSP